MARRKNKVLKNVGVILLILIGIVGLFYILGVQQTFMGAFNTQSVTVSTVLLEETNEGVFIETAFTGYSDDTACSQGNSLGLSNDIQFIGATSLPYDFNNPSSPVNYNTPPYKTNNVEFAGPTATTNVCEEGEGIQSESLSVTKSGSAECEGGHLGDWGDDIICRVTASISADNPSGDPVHWSGLQAMLITSFVPKPGVQCTVREGLTYNCDVGYSCFSNTCVLDPIPPSEEPPEEEVPPEEETTGGNGDQEPETTQDTTESPTTGGGGTAGQGPVSNTLTQIKSSKFFLGFFGWTVIGVILILVILIVFSMFKKGKRRRR